MTFRILIAGLVCLGLASCDVGDTAKAKSAVTHDLKDPASARFRETHRLTRSTDGGTKIEVICGEVNSKNGYGAYSGFSSFFFVVSHSPSKSMPEGAHAVLAPGHFEMVSDEGNGREKVKRICNLKDTLPLPKGTYDYAWKDPCTEVNGGDLSESMLHYLTVKKFGKERTCEVVAHNDSTEPSPNFGAMSLPELVAYRTKLEGYLEVQKFMVDENAVNEKNMKAQEELDKKRPKDTPPE